MLSLQASPTTERIAETQTNAWKRGAVRRARNVRMDRSWGVIGRYDGIADSITPASGSDGANRLRCYESWRIMQLASGAHRHSVEHFVSGSNRLLIASRRDMSRETQLEMPLHVEPLSAQNTEDVRVPNAAVAASGMMTNDAVFLRAEARDR